VKQRPPSRSAFTLVEVMIGASLSAIVMAAVLSSFTFLGRNLARMVSYQSLDSESRKALTYLQRDFALAQAVKTGTTPTASAVTLVLPAGEVTYTYNSANRRLQRTATFGANQNFYLLNNSSCECTSFTFSYFTASGASPTDQVSPTVFVPYSIKQIQARFILESPTAWSANTRTTLETASSQFLFRNKGAPDGT
jgi:hypothetical protein